MLTKSAFIWLKNYETMTFFKWLINDWFLFQYFLNVFYWQTECSASLLKSLMSHDASEIILICGFGLKRFMLFNIFVETHIFFFRIL